MIPCYCRMLIVVVLAFSWSIILSTPAKAGYYQVTSQTGGVTTWLPYGTEPVPYVYFMDGYGGNAEELGSGSEVWCRGEIVTTYEWVRDQISVNGQMQDDPDDNPPDKIVVREWCRALTWSDDDVISEGVVDNGLDHPVNTFTAEGTGGGPTSVYFSTVAEGAREEVIDGEETIEVRCSPSAKINNAGGGRISAHIRYTVSIETKYVSGTNNSFSFQNPAGFTGTLEEYKISINGTQVYSGASIGQGGAMSPLGVKYFSTHFDDDEELQFDFEATNTEGKTWKERQCFVVYNKYSVHYHQSLTNAAESIVRDHLEIMNHTRVAVTIDSYYNKASFLEAIRKATAIQILAHGNTTSYGPEIPSSETTDADDIEEAVAKRYWRPAINIVFAAACATLQGGVTTLPNRFGITGQSIDRAYVGFDAPAAAAPFASEAFWGSLKDRENVEEAKIKAQIEYNKDKTAIGPDNQPREYPAFLQVVGDPLTTLYSRYSNKGYTPWWELMQ